jgi:histidyl-tRNA synthetase
MSDKKQKQKKPQKLKARLARGFPDRSPGRHPRDRRDDGQDQAVYERYGFDPVETPLFEYTDALGKFLPDQDRPNEGVFSLQDDDEQWMSLRYDLTAPLARHVAEKHQRHPAALPHLSGRLGVPQRKAGAGPLPPVHAVRRRHGRRAQRQADAEMCMMMADTMEALGIARGDYVIRVNNRKVLDGVMEAIGVTDDGQASSPCCAPSTSSTSSASKAWLLLLGEGRKDESGDFTPGAGLG